MAERLIAPVLKTGMSARTSGVRIPLPPLRQFVTPGDRKSYLLSLLVFLAMIFAVAATGIAFRDRPAL